MTNKIELVKKLFDQILEPKLKWNINVLGLLKEVKFENETLVVKVSLVTNDQNQIDQFKTDVTRQLQTIHDGAIDLKIAIAGVSSSGIKGIKKIIMVASGKGGVGKSTVSVNLAATLHSLGHKVGLLDADIYGPSIPLMLGVEDKKPSVLQNEYLEPIDVDGLKFISIGSLVGKSKAVDWRGQMASGTILQFIENTAWEELDFLVIDMPPGTGDIHLTIASKIKPDAVVIIATPSEVVLEDVRRSIDLFEKEHFAIAGVVENMSYFVCENCNHENHPFHESDEKLDNFQILQRFPLQKDISIHSDKGKPYVWVEKDSSITQKYNELAQKIKNFVDFVE
ncbi:MAG: Mrp/NBP35 family ATP-binding protein [Campylobacterales bacterium]|nr:Mrp/NBP35 family ATP-binding protein [Campylobacterales bacterium]